MSEEVNFFRSNQVFQGPGTQGWTWPVGQSDHLVIFSFFPDFPGTFVTPSNFSYSKDNSGNCHFDFDATTGAGETFFSVSAGSIPP